LDWGAHAPSRAGDGALAIANLVLSELFGEAPKRAREGACAPQIDSRLLALDARKRIPPKQNAADPPSPGFGATDTAAATD
jgi:hypothetical protein